MAVLLVEMFSLTLSQMVVVFDDKAAITLHCSGSLCRRTLTWHYMVASHSHVSMSNDPLVPKGEEEEQLSLLKHCVQCC